MNCREAQTQIIAERDGALAENERAALVSHLAVCGDCRRWRENLAAAVTHWKTTADTAAVPDAEREWFALRRKLRGAAASGEVRLTPRRLLTWLTVPLATAAALALALFISVPTRHPPASETPPSTAHVARADAVQVSGRNASTLVYVDDKSGWLIVWASDLAPKQG